MKDFLLATSVHPSGSFISSFGKGIIILGRVLLFVLLVASIIFLLFFAETGGVSGLGLIFVVLIWLSIEFAGSIIFYLGKVGENEKNGEQ